FDVNAAHPRQAMAHDAVNGMLVANFVRPCTKRVSQGVKAQAGPLQAAFGQGFVEPIPQAVHVRDLLPAVGAPKLMPNEWEPPLRTKDEPLRRVIRRPSTLALQNVLERGGGLGPKGNYTTYASFGPLKIDDTLFQVNGGQRERCTVRVAKATVDSQE